MPGLSTASLQIIFHCQEHKPQTPADWPKAGLGKKFSSLSLSPSSSSIFLCNEGNTKANEGRCCWLSCRSRCTLEVKGGCHGDHPPFTLIRLINGGAVLFETPMQHQIECWQMRKVSVRRAFRQERTWNLSLDTRARPVCVCVCVCACARCVKSECWVPWI